MLCRPHPLRGATPQRFLISSIYIPRRKSQRGIQPVLYPVCWFTVSALMLWFPAMRNCVSNVVRTSRCRADFFRLSKSRCDLPSRRAPDRLAALLTAFRLSIAFCLRRACTCGNGPAFAHTQVLHPHALARFGWLYSIKCRSFPAASIGERKWNFALTDLEHI